MLLLVLVSLVKWLFNLFVWFLIGLHIAVSCGDLAYSKSSVLNLFGTGDQCLENSVFKDSVDGAEVKGRRSRVIQ